MTGLRIDPQLGLVVAVLAVSTSAILVRWSNAPAVVAACYRVLLPYVTVVYGVAGVCLLAFVLGSGVPVGGYPPREWILFLAMAIGPGIFGHTVLNWALAHVESSLVSVSLLGEPLGSALLALLLLAEVPGPWTLVGGAVILSGITITARGRQSTASA